MLRFPLIKAFSQLTISIFSPNNAFLATTVAILPNKRFDASIIIVSLIMVLFFYPIILTFSAFGFFAISSWIVIALPALFILSRACFENEYAATVIFLVISPEPRTLPGTNAVSLSLTYKESLYKLTILLFLVGLLRSSATALQVFTFSS